MPNTSLYRKPKPDLLVADTVVEYKTCALAGCSRRFDPDRPNQKYCSDTHRKGDAYVKRKAKQASRGAEE